MKTLILTDSYDATTDLLVHYVGNDNIFRLNIDKWEETRIHITKELIKFSIAGNEVSDNEISKVLWRKPLNNDLETDNYISSELKYIFREIFNCFSHQNKTILVTPNIERYIGKIIQMRIASDYFNIPEWEINLNNNFNDGLCVVKSLATEKTNNNKIIYTTKVLKEHLNIKYPWFVQNLIYAKLDITVVYINGKCFSFELKRDNNLIDWRKEINKKNQTWHLHKLPLQMQIKIDLFMKKVELKFGRLDFLYGQSTYYFLEVNPNGQWAWLDLHNKNGLMSEMIRLISPNTEVEALVKTCP